MSIFNMHEIGTPQHHVKRIEGEIGLYYAGVKASKSTWGTTFDTLLTAEAVGVAGNSKTFSLTGDSATTSVVSNPLPATTVIDRAGWRCDQLPSVAGHFIHMFIGYKGANPLTDGIGWKLNVIPHGGLTGVSVVEDTTNKVLTILYKSGTSTGSDIETAIAGSTNFECWVTAGGVAAITGKYIQSAAMNGAKNCIKISGTAYAAHYVDALSTVAEMEALINTNKTLLGFGRTAGTPGTMTIATFDFTATALAGGEDAINPTVLSGNNFSVAYGTTSLIITLDKTYAKMLSKKIDFVSAAATTYQAQFGPVDLSAKTVEIWAWDTNGAAKANPSYLTTSKFTFALDLIEK